MQENRHDELPPPTYEEAMRISVSRLNVLPFETSPSTALPISNIYSSQLQNQPELRIISFGTRSRLVICPKCNRSIHTKTKRSPRPLAYCTSCILCLCFFYFCGCLLPFFMEGCYITRHYCSYCGNYTGKHVPQTN